MKCFPGYFKFQHNSLDVRGFELSLLPILRQMYRPFVTGSNKSAWATVNSTKLCVSPSRAGWLVCAVRNKTVRHWFVPCVMRRSATGLMHVVMQNCAYFIPSKYSFLVFSKALMLLQAVFNEFLEPESCFTMTTSSDIRTPHAAGCCSSSLQHPLQPHTGRANFLHSWSPDVHHTLQVAVQEHNSSKSNKTPSVTTVRTLTVM